jgi:NAD-dependent DNA ligase
MSHPVVQIKKLQGFFAKINTPGFKDANVEKFFHQGYQDINSILFAEKSVFTQLLGPNAGETAYNNLHARLQEITMPLLAAASNCYGRGIGERKLEQLVQQHGDFVDLTFEQILNSRGFDEITAKEIVSGNQAFKNWFETIKHLITISSPVEASNNTLMGQYYVFTGVRDENLKKQLIDCGAQVGDSKSRMTSLICADPNAKTAKIQAAQQRGCEILSLEQAWKRVKEILK